MPRKRLNQISPVEWGVWSVLVVCVAYAIWIIFRIFYMGPFYYVRGHAKTRVLSDFYQLGTTICFLTQESGTQPPVEMGQLLRFSEQIKPGNVLFCEEGPRVDPNGTTFYDIWGNPVRLVVESSHHYRFISNGPNGNYDAGKGDDIVYEFDPWEAGGRQDANTGLNQ